MAGDVAGAGRSRSNRTLAALALLLALAGLWAAQYQPFVFPNNDFYSFRRAALALGEGSLPRSLKRGPLLPAAMAALAPALPGRHPHLHAALVANLAASLAMFAALVAFARRVLPQGAALFAVLLATTPVLHAMALQPLVEPSLGCFVALAFLGLAARSPWQYAAAGAAALSRPDAALLVGALALANAAAERRWLRHGALAALAATPCVLWYGLGGLRGTGAATYLELREAFGGSAPAFLASLPREVFAGWWGRSAGALSAFALAVLVPAAVGAWRALRTAPRETAAMTLWLALSTAAVVLYGVGKARYLHGALFVPLLLFATGVAALGREAAAALGRRREGVRAAAALAAGAAALALLAASGLRLAREELVVAAHAELAFAGLAAVLTLAACADAAREGEPERPGQAPTRRAPGGSAAVAAGALFAFVLAAPVALGGLARKAELLRAVHDFDYAAQPAAQWLGANLGPGERVALLHRSQVIFAAGLPRERVLSFSSFEAEDLPALRAEMRRRGVSHAVYTWRREARTDAERFYDRRRKVALAALFASGGPLEGFEHVATLPAPARLGQPPAQVYRLTPDAPATP
jgi:hypothetical protein